MSGYDEAYMYSKQSCEMCGRGRVEFHHAIYRRNKSIPELNAPENLLALCNNCHAEFHAEGYSGRCRAWRMKCEEFGREHMVEWHEGLPLVAKENFE